MTEKNNEEEQVAPESVTDENTVEQDTAETTETAEVDEVTQLKQSLDDMEDKFLRTQAELANMRSRFQKEREQLAKYRSQDLAKALIPAVDNLERALAIEVHDEAGANLKKGIEMVLESVHAAFKQEGIEEIEAMGKTFDPNLHQAVQTIPVEEGQQAEEIVQVLQTGYLLKDRVLRPTMVIVAQ